MNPLSKDTINEILELSGGDDSLLIELFELFLFDTKILVEGIALAFKKSDWDKLEYDLHTLKGLCGTIGANPLFEVCKILNERVKNSEYDNLKSLIDELFISREELVDYIIDNYNVKYAA